MKELLSEIGASIRKNKLRTVLTGFSVAWGIFMFVALLGCGNGFLHAFEQNFEGRAINKVTLFSGWTSMPYGGYPRGRYVPLCNEDLEIIVSEFPEVGIIASRGWYTGGLMVYGERFRNVNMVGATPSTARIDGLRLLEGRFINEQDMQLCRRVVVIDQPTATALFGTESVLGREVRVRNSIFQVVGLYKSEGFGNQSSGYIPITTGQMVYDHGNTRINSIQLTIDGIETDEEMDRFEKELIACLARFHRFDPNDRNAIYLANSFRWYRDTMKSFRYIQLFIWVIGLGTLFAGVVGVSNIMLVTVRERTFEFGIRKALGAPPWTIVRQILLESVLITAFFGYCGMVAGVAVMEGVDWLLTRMQLAGGEDFGLFVDPTLDLSVTFSATLLLVLSGLVAGYIPARRAARLKTVDALRYNK